MHTPVRQNLKSDTSQLCVWFFLWLFRIVTQLLELFLFNISKVPHRYLNKEIEKDLLHRFSTKKMNLSIYLLALFDVYNLKQMHYLNSLHSCFTQGHSAGECV